MIKAFMPLLSSHEPLAASGRKQSELPPAVRVYPADPESGIRGVQTSVTAHNDRQKLQKNHAGKSFMVAKSFYLLFSQRKHGHFSFFNKGSRAAATMQGDR